MAIIFSVTYYKNDGSGTTLYCEDDAKHVLDEITTVGAVWGETPQNWSRTGYNFLYWNTAADGSGTSIPAGEIFTGRDATVYAIWQAVAGDDVVISLGETEITTMTATGTKTLATQGTYVADDITIEYTKPTPRLQAKTGISPSTSSQTITPDSGYSGLSSVQINAMTTMTLPTSTSSSSLGSQKATITPTTTTKYLNIPIGYNSTRSYYTLVGDANLTAGNIKKDVVLFGITGTYDGGGGGASVATYTIQASSHPILGNAGFDLSSAGLSAIDLALDGNTFWWIETTASVTIDCWLDSDDDDDFTITLPSGTKMMVAETATIGSSVNCYVMCHTSSTYGFVNISAAEEDDFASFTSYGDTASLGGFVRSIAYKAQNGCPHMSLGSSPPFVLYIKKIITS